MLVFVVCVSATSCAHDNPFQIWSDAQTTTIFFGTIEASPDDITGPGFIYGPLNVRWKGEKPLKLVSIQFSIPAGGKLSGDYTCTIDSEVLDEAFPTIPSTLTIEPGETHHGISVVCSGLSAENNDDQFIVTGNTKARGFTGSATDQKFYNAETRFFLYWFPENAP